MTRAVCGLGQVRLGRGLDSAGVLEMCGTGLQLAGRRGNLRDPEVEFPILLVGRLPHQLLICPANFFRF